MPPFINFFVGYFPFSSYKIYSPFPFLTEPDSFVNRKILEIYLDENLEPNKDWVNIRPIPKEDTWFENVWNEFMKDNIIDK